MRRQGGAGEGCPQPRQRPEHQLPVGLLLRAGGLEGGDGPEQGVGRIPLDRCFRSGTLPRLPHAVEHAGHQPQQLVPVLVGQVPGQHLQKAVLCRPTVQYDGRCLLRQRQVDAAPVLAVSALLQQAPAGQVFHGTAHVGFG